MLSAGLLAYSNWLILSVIVVPRFLEFMEPLPDSHLLKLIDICDSVDLSFGVEVFPSMLLSVLGGEVFSFAEFRIDHLLAEEDCPFFAVAGELGFASFESRDTIWILLFLTEPVTVIS